MWRWLMGAALALAPMATGAQSTWRTVEMADVRDSADWQFRQNGANFLTAIGDFNGDGKPDRARFVMNQTSGRYAVDVEMPDVRWARRIAEGPLSDLGRMGLSMVGPGLYLTACAKGYGDDAQPCERRNVTLENDGISLFQFESGGRYLYWNGTGFSEVWISD